MATTRTIELNTDLQALYNYLRIDAYGMRNGKTQQELAARFGINVRTVQARLTSLVADNFKCICTTAAAGVYIPKTREEADAGIKSLYSRELEIRKRRQALENAAEYTFGAPQLFDMDSCR
jgi:DNA-binding transcriptional regulator YhcF (GntR family)